MQKRNKNVNLMKRAQESVLVEKNEEEEAQEWWLRKTPTQLFRTDRHDENFQVKCIYQISLVSMDTLFLSFSTLLPLRSYVCNLYHVGSLHILFASVADEALVFYRCFDGFMNVNIERSLPANYLRSLGHYHMWRNAESDRASHVTHLGCAHRHAGHRAHVQRIFLPLILINSTRQYCPTPCATPSLLPSLIQTPLNHPQPSCQDPPGQVHQAADQKESKTHFIHHNGHGQAAFCVQHCAHAQPTRSETIVQYHTRLTSSAHSSSTLQSIHHRQDSSSIQPNTTFKHKLCLKRRRCSKILFNRDDATRERNPDLSFLDAFYAQIYWKRLMQRAHEIWTCFRQDMRAIGSLQFRNVRFVHCAWLGRGSWKLIDQLCLESVKSKNHPSEFLEGLSESTESLSEFTVSVSEFTQPLSEFIETLSEFTRLREWIHREVAVDSLTIPVDSLSFLVNSLNAWVNWLKVLVNSILTFFKIAFCKPWKIEKTNFPKNMKIMKSFVRLYFLKDCESHFIFSGMIFTVRSCKKEHISFL